MRAQTELPGGDRSGLPAPPVRVPREQATVAAGAPGERPVGTGADGRPGGANTCPNPHSLSRPRKDHKVLDDLAELGLTDALRITTCARS